MTRSLWICLLLLSQSLFAAELIIDDQFKRLDLTTPIATAIDTKASGAEYMLKFADFNPVRYQESLSPNTSSYWYKIELSASGLSQPKNLALLSQSQILQHFDIYLFQQGKLLQTAQLGIKDRPASNDVYQGVVFKFPVKVGDKLTLLIRKESDGPAIMPLSLMDDQSLNNHQVITLFFWGGAVGVILALAAYNGFIYALNRQRSQYGWYLLFQLFIFLTFAPLFGFGYLIFPDALCRWLGSHIGVLHLMSLWCALMFGHHFLDIKKFRPKTGRIIEKSGWILAVLLLISFQLTELQRMYVTSVLIVIVCYVCIGTAIIALRKQYSPASFYLLSWVCTWVGAICGFLTYSNILPQNIITMHSFMIGILAELYLLSVSLAKRLQYQEQQEEQHRLIDHTLNMPNQIFYQYVLKDQLAERGLDIRRIKLVLVHLEGMDHLISTMGAESVASEARTLLEKIACQVSELSWQIDLTLDKKYFGVSLSPQQTLVFVSDDLATEKQVEVLSGIWQNQLAGSLYFSDLHLRAASASVQSEEEEISDLHQKAYMALLEAQKRNLKWLPFHEQMTEEAEAHVKILHELKLAIARRQLDIYIQPQVDLTTGKVVGGEALMRWTHPVMGMIPPGEFIPIAEQSGLINSLTCIAFEKVFSWLEQSKVTINISINISVLDLQEKDFIEFLQETSARYSVDTSKVTLEITESQELDSSDDFAKNISAIKELGFAISIDDFGTGYSSTAYLSQLNIDEVKIDRVFIPDIQNNTANQTIVKTLLSMADAFDARTVIEGIETQEELDIVRKLNGTVGQGYFWSPAISTGDFSSQYLS
ncbi:EAL domain-containing protein [Vibrio sp. JC009]|uniref:EAL domain-containing protein n=1 Tax=Vibrio sp. JC009 TaxID=2912314 RepID=UPI0023B016BB|nr:EAL domain-containing protein [Vibrio sp. JC009]WED22658.1 EAL domain-containing protein [Vibrio sp. JC009]